MKPAILRILDDMFADVYVSTNESEAMAAVAVALVRLGNENAVDVAEIVTVLWEKQFELSKHVEQSEAG